MSALDAFLLEPGEVATVERDVDAIKKAKREDIKSKLVKLLEKYGLLEILVLVHAPTKGGERVLIVVLGGVVH